jgi:hypothetical protein
LDEFSCLINSNESRRRGHVVATELPLRELEKRALVVGKPFVYERSGTTTEIEEVVAATGKYYGPGTEDLRELTRDKYNSVCTLSNFVGQKTSENKGDFSTVSRWYTPRFAG